MFQEDFDDNFENTGVTAIALYDYQAAADDEISFDPNDIITNIEMVRVFIIFLVLCLGMFLFIGITFMFCIVPSNHFLISGGRWLVAR